MRLGKPSDKLSLAIGLRPTLFEVRKILEQVAKQFRVAGADLIERSGDHIRCVLRKRELGALDVAHERGKSGSWCLETLPDGALNFSPAEEAVRDDGSPGCLGQVQGHLKIRGELEHVQLPATLAA